GTFNSFVDRNLVQWYTTGTPAAGNGTMFTLQFSVKSGAAKGSYVVNVKPLNDAAENITDGNSNTLEVGFEQGSVTIADGILGDVTGDGKVAMGDVLKLAQAVAGNLTLTKAESALADVTGDGKIAMGDVLKLAQFVAGNLASLETPSSTARLAPLASFSSPEPVSLKASGKALIEADEVTGEKGKTVQIPVRLTENPGIAAAMFEVTYQKDVLTLTGVDKGEVLSSGTFNAYADTGTIQWYDTKSADGTGVLFTLNFQVAADAKDGEYPISLAIKGGPENLTDINYDNVDYAITNGKVTIGDPKPSVILPEKITLDQTAISLDMGGTATLKAEVTPENAENKKVLWTSDKPDIAEVDANGKITAKAAGEAKITAKAEAAETVTAECTVTVKAAGGEHVLVTKISVKPFSVELILGEDQSYQLSLTVEPENATDKSVTWSSSNEAVATVSQTGLVTPVAGGYASIYARANDGSGEWNLSGVTVVDKTKAKIGTDLYNDAEALAEVAEMGAIPSGLWIAGLKEKYDYPGLPITPNIRVYSGSDRLRLNKEYKVSFKN
ncbi:MAG: Ig-like domain-containing protein, partial [Lachnospiraceae bacterium]|nr:Ig-like domain-containing protein [Lachnospiraceae bacterium]